MKPLVDKELSEARSIVALLDDSDVEVVNAARDRILALGEGILPLLDEASAATGELHSERISQIREVLVGSLVRDQLRALLRSSNGNIGLEEGAFAIARLGYPTTEMAPYVEALNQFAHDLDGRLDLSHEPEDLLLNINKYFFGEVGFHGNKEDYYNPDNQFLNRVIETRGGAPISLSVVCILVARRLNIPIAGIALPGHFVVRYDLHSASYYVDPFNEGRMMTRNDCIYFLNSAGYPFREEYLTPASDKLILERMMRNLIRSAERDGPVERCEVLRQCIDILNSTV